MLEQKILNIKTQALEEIKKTLNEKDLFNLRVKYLGRKSEFNAILKNLRNLSGEEKRKIGPLANAVKKEIEDELKSAEKLIKSKKFDHQAEKIDITAPGNKIKRGHLHPITKIQNEVEDIFALMGFEIAEGPEVETDFYNFDSLNIPKDHPARDMMDTFRIKEKKDVLLRTHVSAIQVRYMEKNKPPFRVVMPGRVFRNEATDVSHEHTFYQMDGMMAGEDVSAANYYAIIGEFLKRFFGKNIKTRMRPSFFPFTEPSFEIDFECLICKGKGCAVCKNTGWIEIIPGGMINQHVFVSAGYPRNKYQGFAFDIGITRLAMMKYKIDDIRLFHSGDLRFIKQF
ncbi:MAG: phenylalanine--tRNA ligase subunit alpha [Candidatus Moranbacteria bacterium RIFCSPHIGHO2_02_FULL_40_12b]|nr:MAG: phenylalanine--tRNA ligase subunit alpha [Candidatus Moranbacteria bacterium RIFCSPHIGHO2_02_FULL_40_12b]OGI24256.1 MAG: phenylalanine--tRNA ligase subunit alpha [Candidatus Moranbacteria bacterium RIFCSPHIGHO2_12_FULL_40_10]